MDPTAARTRQMRLPIIAAHFAQALLAIIVLGLAAYGVDYISYNVLIYSLVVSICTLGVSSWMIATRTILTKSHNIYVSLALHAWILVLWIVNLGLTANLAHEWNPQCSFTPEAGKICLSFAKRDTTFRTYFGALVASAVLISFEVVLFIGTTTLLALDLKCRQSTVSQIPLGEPVQRSSAETTGEADFEKPANIFDTVSPSAPIRDHAEPVLPPASPDYDNELIEPFPPGALGTEPQPSHHTTLGPAKVA